MDYTPDTSLPLEMGDVVEGMRARIDRCPDTPQDIIQAIFLYKISLAGGDSSLYLCSTGRESGGTPQEARGVLLTKVKKLGVASTEFLLTHPNCQLRNAGLKRAGCPIVVANEILNMFSVKKR
jgi:hypothetical protein